MKQLLILSGKGGTGKTTTAAAFIHFSSARAVADCDVDAPNLHIVNSQQSQPEELPFFGGDKAQIDLTACTDCGACAQSCRFGAIRRENNAWQVDEFACEGCGVCEHICPQQAVKLHQDLAGTRNLWNDERIFATATLKMGRGNSGKLVSQVKSDMLSCAGKAGDVELAVIDGSPGIGCPVIASVSGVDLVLIVAEPSLSGLSDLQRVVKTAAMLCTPVAVCINKWDASPDKAQKIEEYCAEQNIPFVGKVPYDKRASQAINAGVSIAEYDCPARDALYDVYQRTMAVLEEQP